MEKYPLAPLLKVREYREDAAKNALSAAERAVVEAQEAVERAEPPKAVKERTERPQRGNKAQQAARRQLTICERDIAKIEARITELDAAMEAAACDYEKLHELLQEKERVQRELDELYERWESLSEEAEG